MTSLRESFFNGKGMGIKILEDGVLDPNSKVQQLINLEVLEVEDVSVVDSEYDHAERGGDVSPSWGASMSEYATCTILVKATFNIPLNPDPEELDLFMLYNRKMEISKTLFDNKIVWNSFNGSVLDYDPEFSASVIKIQGNIAIIRLYFENIVIDSPLSEATTQQQVGTTYKNLPTYAKDAIDTNEAIYLLKPILDTQGDINNIKKLAAHLVKEYYGGSGESVPEHNAALKMANQMVTLKKDVDECLDAMAIELKNMYKNKELGMGTAYSPKGHQG
jgi:hypothetical protein